jgi:uncharacterized membrane protein
MRKERLELFSDGVFAIILTLLVIDLEVPRAFGLAGLREATPGLLVHAGAFFVIGMAWITHHQFFEHIRTVGRGLLGWNLLVLFWITLVPYGARIAAADPGNGLGAAMMAGCVTLSLASTIAMVWLGKFDSAVMDSRNLSWRRRRRNAFLGEVALGIVCTALSFVSPWFGYAYLSLGIAALVVKPVSDVLAAQQAAEAAEGA